LKCAHRRARCVAGDDYGSGKPQAKACDWYHLRKGVVMLEEQQLDDESDDPDQHETEEHLAKRISANVENAHEQSLSEFDAVSAYLASAHRDRLWRCRRHSWAHLHQVE
jgi:hypothetical protein